MKLYLGENNLKKLILFIVVFGLFITACGSSLPNTPVTGTWDIVSYGSASAPTPALPDLSRSIIFGADGKFSGNVGCNSFSGTYTIVDNNITIQQTSSTMLACPPDALMQQEEATLRILSNGAQFKLEGRFLTFTNNGETLLMEAGGN